MDITYSDLRINEDYSEIIVYCDGKQFGEIRRYVGGNGEWDVSNEIEEANNNLPFGEQADIYGHRNLNKVKSAIELMLMF